MRQAFFFAIAVPTISSSVLTAQVIETPQSFDTDGRILALTPSAAARIGLGPPEWRIFGDYVDARLYQSSAGGHVIVVARRNQVLERYDVSPAEVSAIRQKVNALPPQFAFRTEGRASSRFVRNQTLTGLALYAPALALAVANEATGRGSTYLVAAGATFFAATQLARQIEITPEMNSLATHMSLRGGLIGAGLTYAVNTSGDGQAWGVLLGALGGTATGLALGRGWTGQEAVASELGADVFALTTLGVIQIARGSRNDSRLLTRGEAAMLTGVGITGYVLGRSYGRHVAHNITPGDGRALWVTGAIGAAAGSITYAGRDVGHRGEALALTGGYVAGVVAGEVLLSRRFDLSVSDASLLGLGSGAGGLIGLGVARLIYSDGNTDARTMSFTTLGGLGGLFLTHYLLAPPVDAGRDTASGGSRSAFRFNPLSLALTAGNVPGSFPLLSVTFR